MTDFQNGSASSARRTIACPAWLAFPHVDRETEDASRGTSLHRFGKAVLTGSSLAVALDHVKDPAIRSTCAAIDWQRVGGDLRNVTCEAAYAVDVRARTARFIGYDIGRDYEKDAPLGEWEVPGAIDLLGENADGRPVIDDLKTGFLDVEPAASNAQGLMLASAVHLAHDAPEVEFRISHLKASGNVWNEAAVHTAIDIDGFLDEYEAAIVESREAKRVYLAGGTPNVTEGDHCRYCPSADSCPAKTKLVKAMLPELEGIDAALAVATPQQAGAAWALAHDRIKPLLERIIDLLKERAKREKLPLPDGRELRESTSVRELLHAETILALARRHGASEDEIVDCYRESTVSRIIAAKPPQARRGR